MHFAFDLISDLHVETWDSLDWTGQPTSPYCVVAGDVGRDRTQVMETLTHLGNCYAGVFYIDGNLKHNDWSNLRSVCANCRIELNSAKTTWRESPLTPDF